MCQRASPENQKQEGLSCPECSLTTQVPLSSSPRKCRCRGTGLHRSLGGESSQTWHYGHLRGQQSLEAGVLGDCSFPVFHFFNVPESLWQCRRRISINRCSVNKNLLFMRNKARKLHHNLWLKYRTGLLTDTPDERGSNEHKPSPLYWRLMALDRSSSIWGWVEGQNTTRK